MKIEYLSAKNQETTLKVDSFFLHSSYNPSKEAERFVNLINCDFVPKYILIFEPGLGYILPFLRNKFPSCKIGSYSVLNINSENSFDFIINNNDNSSFREQLLKYIPEEEIFLTLFLSWEPSQKCLPNDFSNYSLELKNIIEDSKTLLITRQYFEKKWLINSCNFLSYSKTYTSIKSKVSVPIVICASGPSLKRNLNLLKQYQDKIFIICLSSAIYTLYKNDIKPDLYFSTDGGFWANFHLRKIERNIPLVISPESFLNKNILQCNSLLPIIYSDGVSSQIKKNSNIQFYSGERNGTVSGTALKFAFSISEKPVYFLGLDLSSCKAHQHTQPNELEIRNSVFDTRINTMESRIYPSSLPNKSLEIYKNWFDNQVFPNKVFRIINNDEKSNTISSIRDISSKEFENQLSQMSEKKQSVFSEFKRNSEEINQECKNYFNLINKYFENKENLKNIFSLDYISSMRNPDNIEIQNKLQKESSLLITKVKEILNDK